MGWASKGENCLSEGAPLLFPASDLPEIERLPEKNFKSLECPLWTENKAKLIQEYIRLFTFITKHGAYIDGFAAPQRRNHPENCSARLVLENKPQWVRQFWLCDIDDTGISHLRTLQREYQDTVKHLEVVQGDFNSTVLQILNSGRITEKTATFALLDQRTFECDWATVEELARYKSGRKIELFYFFPTGWVDRSIAAIRTEGAKERARKWWGRDDWRSLRGLQSIERANMLAERFRSELGYRWVYPYAIHNAARKGRTMYHMIHATDHDDASPLMLRAYRKVSGRLDWDRPIKQTDLEELWGNAA